MVKKTKIEYDSLYQLKYFFTVTDRLFLTVYHRSLEWFRDKINLSKNIRQKNLIGI